MRDTAMLGILWENQQVKARDYLCLAGQTLSHFLIPKYRWAKKKRPDVLLMWKDVSLQFNGTYFSRNTAEDASQVYFSQPL